MPALIVFAVKITDREQFKVYQAAGRHSFAGVEFRMVAGPHPDVTLEGGPFDETIVLEFPTRAAAEAWYRSPAYQEAVALRASAAETSAFIIDTR